MKYLISDNQNRESLILRNLLTSQLDAWMEPLGLNFAWWAIMQFNKNNYGRRGDVDVLFGNLEVRDNGDVKWPPSTNYLVACEAKCAYFQSEDGEADGILKATKKSKDKTKGIRTQLRELYKDGYSKIILIDFIANPPNGDCSPWIKAAVMAEKSIEMGKEGRHQFLMERLATMPESVGHVCVSLAPIENRDENESGVMNWEWLTPPLLTGKSPSEEIKESLREKFLSVAPPVYYQTIFEECADGTLKHYPGDLLRSSVAAKVLREKMSKDCGG